MELYHIVTIIDNDKSEMLASIHEECKISIVYAFLAKGTASAEHLSLFNLQPKPKRVFLSIATRESTRLLMKNAKLKMKMDIPGNGIMMAVPIKSVMNKNSLDYIVKDQEICKENPKMNFKHELIVSIINEGHSDELMDVARSIGAGGGSVIHAKGTSRREEKFYGLSLGKMKDVVLILAGSDIKTKIMEEINKKCGKDTEVNAISFSLPVSEVVGLRILEE